MKPIYLLFIMFLFLSGRRHHFEERNILSEYEVRLTHTGYTSFYGDPDDCPIRDTGSVVLTGFLTGNENVAPDDDILYKGILQIKIDMDICSATRMANGEDRLCGMTVKGSGPVNTELEINSDGQDAARGAYIKFNYEPTLGKFNKSVVGSCDSLQMAEEMNMIPNKTIASVFNGLDLPMLTTRRLQVGRFEEKDNKNVTVVEVLRKVH
jgi:hypothetical protein